MGTEPTGNDLHRRRLAARIAEERRKRAGRAAAEASAAPEAGSAADAAAMRDFLTRLTGGLGLSGRTPAPEAVPVPRAVLPFPASVASPQPPREAGPGPDPAPPEYLEALAVALEAACDLDRLPGAGPGLVWALRRAGLRRLDDLAGLEPEDLAERLGPVGLLVPLERWIGVARSGAAA